MPPDHEAGQQGAPEGFAFEALQVAHLGDGDAPREKEDVLGRVLALQLGEAVGDAGALLVAPALRAALHLAQRRLADRQRQGQGGRVEQGVDGEVDEAPQLG